MVLFNRSLLKQNIDRSSNNFGFSDFIYQEAGEIIAGSAQDCKENFHDILEIGARTGFLGKKILTHHKSANLTQIDPSPLMVAKHGLTKVMDDEELNFEDESFDLIVSNLNLHFINDLPGHFRKIKNLLKPEGVFIYSFFGEENLKELREVFFKSEEEIYQKISPRISPNIDIKSAGMLAQKSGFLDIISERHSLSVEYSELKKLFHDLRNMAQTNILNERSRKFMTKKFLFSLTENYKKLYSSPQNTITTTFEFIVLTGCKKSLKKQP